MSAIVQLVKNIQYLKDFARTLQDRFVAVLSGHSHNDKDFVAQACQTSHLQRISAAMLCSYGS